MTPLRLAPDHARRFMRRALLLDAPVPDVAAALAHHGYIQIDPLNICGRMHDLILRNRVAGYREGDLMRHLHGDAAPKPAAARTAFEHHHPEANILVAFGHEAWPHLLGAMRRRTHRSGPWSGRLSAKQKALAEKLLAEIAARGPLSAEDFDDHGRARQVWGAASLVKATLQKLFFHGRLLIARRGTGNRRYYDLPERILPASLLAQPEPPRRATARWCAELKLRQRRLCTLKRTELPLVADLVQPVAVDGCPPLYCLQADLPALELAASDLPRPAPAPLLLAPLDPLIYDRRVTASLWNFAYTWEAYTPPAQRVRGHYSLPLLAGTELVGHVDPKADRAAGRLRVTGRAVKRGYASAAAVAALARWLGLK
ncbi:DNA glycosylase AlkZ-like family protein [Oleiharenicola sp. Vm1]|uniref:DNA glycosylase AlkZ-like family protein n=1 Tax=Oleiharenicola sp. Vm1 TaxID=3398393 RepID=UPI0039F448D9